MTFYKTSPACGMAHGGLPMLRLPSLFDSQDQHSWARKINVQNKNKTKIKALFRGLLGYISTAPRNLWGRDLLSISGWYMEDPLGFMICPHHPIKAPSAFLYLTAVGLHWRTKHTQKKTSLCSGRVWGKILQNTGSGFLWGDKKAFIFESNRFCSWSVMWINKESTIACSICRDQELEQWVITLEPAKPYSPTPDQPVEWSGYLFKSGRTQGRMHTSTAGT